MLRRIFIPLMLPAIAAVAMLAAMRSLDSFEIEQVLGPRFGLRVMSTWIYQTLYQAQPRYDAAAAMAVLLIVTMLLAVLLQRRMVGRRRYQTVGSHFKGQVVHLRAWRWPAFALMTLLLTLIMGVPMVFSTMGTFMKLFGFFIAAPWTLDHWTTALSDRILLQSLLNTVLLAAGAAVGSAALSSLLAYVIVRTKLFGREALDVLSWVPVTMPGILLSLAMLDLFLTPLFRPLFGTLFVLIVASVLAGLPLAVQILKSNLMQLGVEMEEAVWAAGGKRWQGYVRIVLPLLRPTMVIVGLVAFIGAARNIATVSLLSNSANRPLSMLQLDYMAQGKFEVASVVACIILFMTIGLAVVARLVGYRGGIAD